MAALPREVFFEVMRSQFRITYKELCDCILSDRPVGGMSAKDRGRDAARRNREFIHVAPGTYDAAWQLAPPEQYMDNLHDCLVGILGEQETIALAIDVLSGSGAEALRDSLEACGLNASIYTNVVNYIVDGSLPDETTGGLLVHLFVATAISGNPEESAREVIAIAKAFDPTYMFTSTPPLEETDSPQIEGQGLALMRCVGNSLFPSRTYPLSSGPDGTDVGSILLSSTGITDVERGVSRRHLHIWCDRNGLWWCKGLDSLNGTVLVKWPSNERIVVEPPRDKRPADYEPTAYRLELADRLILADNTEFLVVAICL